jgi:ferredoxin, 2Fe-2S
MAKLTIVGRDGTERTVEGRSGWTVMENIREAGFNELVAMCGGSCNCATCHVHVDAAWMPVVGPPGRDEDELLESSDHKAPNSRLSCQIDFGPELDGLRLVIAPDD